jgi:hypothetical protein
MVLANPCICSILFILANPCVCSILFIYRRSMVLATYRLFACLPCAQPMCAPAPDGTATWLHVHLPAATCSCPVPPCAAHSGPHAARCPTSPAARSGMGPHAAHAAQRMGPHAAWCLGFPCSPQRHGTPCCPAPCPLTSQTQRSRRQCRSCP